MVILVLTSVTLCACISSRSSQGLQEDKAKNPLLFNPALTSAKDIKIAWDANTEPDIGGYKVYFGTAPRKYGPPIDVGNVTTYTITGAATTGGILYFAITAYDKAGNESPFSDEVNTSIPTPPPSRLHAVPPPPSPLPSQPKYEFYIGSSGNGWMSITPNQRQYNSGDVVTLTANPSSGYKFDHWSGDVTGTQNPLNFALGEKKTLHFTANFVPITRK